MAVNLHELSEALLPRRYQEEIFSRAQDRNVIAALDTGSGKTFISTLLIKWIAARDAGLGKTIVFLVPKVALVEQQGDFIAKETPLRVSKCYGATAIDLADRTAWRNEIQSHDVLVMTAQIFLNILTHSHWSLDKVSLMVFDECHHTRKNHAYNGIMREYYQWPPEARPKIFGMTASPIWNPKDAVESLATLERNLDAKVIAVREHVNELLDHSPRPQEIVHQYSPPPDLFPRFASTTLWERLNLLQLPPEIDIPVSKIRTRYDVSYQCLGLYGAELYLYTDIKYRMAQFLCKADEDVDFMSHPIEDTLIAHDVTLPPELEEMSNILQEFRQYFEDESDPEIIPIRIDKQWCTPKVRLLADLLFDHYRRDFQGIVFVEQRHVAACLARMLPRMPQLEMYIRSAQLIGHGTSSLARTQMRGMGLKTQQDVVKMFREGEINLLVATSVAEEGLDFPACELVIRFDPMQHMVGYIQSRGRARQKMATFVVMVQEGQNGHVERYRTFSESEPHLRLVYQTRDQPMRSPAEEEEEERDDPADLLERERYVVPSTGAILTYTSAIGLLNHLCSLIPRDRFTPVHLPLYAGDFEATLQLPCSLPLPPQHLNFTGPPKRSKKEAKRAVAFLAVKQLHALNVFDDYLLPAKTCTGDNEDADGRAIDDVSHIPEMMDVLVRDPWAIGSKVWGSTVYLDGRPTAALVTGTPLPAVDLVCNETYICTGEPRLVPFDKEEEWRQRRAIQDYMRMGLWWCITGRGITLPLTSYLVPITHSLDVDWDTIDQALLHPYGSYDWSGITEEHCNHLLVVFNREPGRPYLLRRIRTDLSPMSAPPEGSRETGFPTYREYIMHKYARKGVPPEVPTEGPLIEALLYPRHISTMYNLDGSSPQPEKSVAASNVVLLPQTMCRWAALSEDMYHTFHILPELSHRTTDIYRARCARAELALPPVIDDLLVQALTLPSANAGFSNQRLETLGDSVLKLSTVVHLFNRFPHRHEGQLDVLRRNSVSNRTLLSRAKEHGLEHFLTCEPQTLRMWRYTLAKDATAYFDEPQRYVSRRFARRSLQDCMEAILGASFVTGGVPMALRAGTALGLGFGGPLPWTTRYRGLLEEAPVSQLFTQLQEVLSYKFRCGRLLIEAITHPSFRSPDSSSYQRLEFLGDALIDLVVMRYLFNKFPDATSGQLSWARSRAVCAPALASVAVKRLELHKMLLINNVELSMAIGKYVPILEKTTAEEIIHNGWKQDPPKAISDVLESVLGAVLVDTDYDFDKAAVIVEAVLSDLLEVLSPRMPRDPVSELMVWSGQAGCRKISFRKAQSRPDARRNDSISVVVHDLTIVGPILATNLSLAKGLAAERARQILGDASGPYLLSRVCDCNKTKNPGVVEPKGDDMDISDAKKLDDETEEGFAALARIAMSSAHGTDQKIIQEADVDSKDTEDALALERDEQEVEEMLQVVYFSDADDPSVKTMMDTTAD